MKKKNELTVGIILKTSDGLTELELEEGSHVDESHLPATKSRNGVWQ